MNKLVAFNYNRYIIVTSGNQSRKPNGETKMTHTLNKTVGGLFDGFYVIAVHEINGFFDKTYFEKFTSKKASLKFMKEVNQAYIPRKEQLEQFQF